MDTFKTAANDYDFIASAAIETKRFLLGERVFRNLFPTDPDYPGRAILFGGGRKHISKGLLPSGISVLRVVLTGSGFDNLADSLTERSLL